MCAESKRFLMVPAESLRGVCGEMIMACLFRGMFNAVDPVA